MNIKISTFKSMIHNEEEINTSSCKYLSRISEMINEELKLTNLEDYDCDLKMIFIETGGSEGLFIENIDKLQEPYYLLTSGENNSLAASLEILTYLRNNNKKGEVIHGSVEYVASRIKEIAKQNMIISNLRKSRFGIVGKPSDWLISSIPNRELLKDKLGVELMDISLKEVEDYYNKISFNDIKVDAYFDEEELKKAKKIYQGLSSIVNKYELSGLTIRCFDLLKSVKTTGCLGLSILNRDDIIATCEGDIMAMISMYIARLVSSQSSFQANPSRINVTDKEVIFAHCTLPLDMVTSYRFDTHFESGIGVAIKGELKEENVTVFRLSSNLKDYFVEEGKIIENLDDKSLCRTQIKVKFNQDISSLLTNPCGNHHIIFYGNYKKEIVSLLNTIL